MSDLGKCSVVIAFWDKNGFLWPLGLFQSLNPLSPTFRLACFCNIETNTPNYTLDVQLLLNLHKDSATMGLILLGFYKKKKKKSLYVALENII